MPGKTPLREGRNEISWMEVHEVMVRRSNAHPPTILLIGDSILADCGFSDPTMLNLSHPGDRIGNACWRLLDKRLNLGNVKTAIVLIGTNNVLINNQDQMKSQFRHLLRLLKAAIDPNARIIVSTILPRADKPGVDLSALVGTRNQAVLAAAQAERVESTDLAALFADSSGALKLDLYQSDRLHLSPEGQYLLRAKVTNVLLGLRP